MKKILFGFFAIFLTFVLSTGVVLAQKSGDSKNVTLGRDEVIERDYFARGEVVTVSGTVNGDVYAFGEKVVVDGEVNGDVIAAGGTLEIPGRVSGDARVAGGQITIDGQIEGSLTAGGGNIIIDDDATIGKSIVVGAGSLKVDGSVGRGAMIGAGDATLNSRIGGSVTAGVGTISVGEGAEINRDFNYWSESDATIASTAVISGATTKHAPPVKDRDTRPEGIAKAISGFWLVWSIASLIAGVIIGLVLIKIAPNFTNDVLVKYQKRPWASLGIGLLTVILAPILFILLLVTVIGISFALILLLSLVLLWIFIKVFVALCIGRYIQDKMKLARSDLMALIVGLVIWAVVSHIPVVGGIFVFVASLVTIGVVLMTKKEYFHKLSSKKLL